MTLYNTSSKTWYCYRNATLDQTLQGAKKGKEKKGVTCHCIGMTYNPFKGTSIFVCNKDTSSAREGVGILGIHGSCWRRVWAEFVGKGR